MHCIHLHLVNIWSTSIEAEWHTKKISVGPGQQGMPLLPGNWWSGMHQQQKGEYSLISLYIKNYLNPTDCHWNLHRNKCIFPVYICTLLRLCIRGDRWFTIQFWNWNLVLKSQIGETNKANWISLTIWKEIKIETLFWQLNCIKSKWVNLCEGSLM